MTNEDTRDRLADTLAGPMETLGLDLEAVELTAAGRRRMLRVAIDRDGGVTLDDVADATREVSRALDESDAMGSQPYTLEVTSPGTDRPLTLPRHWRRNQGRLVSVTTDDGASRTGRIVRSDEESATLDVDGTEHVLRIESVTKAKVQVELTRGEKGGATPWTST